MISIRKEKPVTVNSSLGGFIILDKPAGPSSHEVTAWIKKMLGTKAGHAGTLDPFATGVLVIAVGKAVSLLHTLAHNDKEYIGIMRFEREPQAEQLKQMFKEFTGEIYQTPPKESAVKKQLRTRKIYSLELLEIAGKNALFKTVCQHGTYIRTLAADIGEVMGNKAVLVELRRTRAGTFTEKDAVILQDIADARNPWELVKPVETLALKKIVVGNKAVNAVCYGAKLAKPGVVALSENIEEGETVLLVTSAGQAIGIARALKTSEEINTTKKGFVAQPIRILMQRDLFPKWK